MKKQFGGVSKLSLDIRPRLVLMSWEQFEVICEALHNYKNAYGKKPNVDKTKRIAAELVKEWHKSDVEDERK